MFGLDFTHLTSGIAGGALGIIGHLGTTALSYAKDRLDFKKSALSDQTQLRDDAIKADSGENLKIGRIKPTEKEADLLVKVAALRRSYHALYALVSGAILVAMLFVDIPADRQWVAHAIVLCATMSASWSFGAATTR